MSMIGSALVLIAYAITVRLPDRKRIYFSMSALGAVALFGTAWIYQNAGLLFLELAWFALNVWGLYRTCRRQPIEDQAR